METQNSTNSWINFRGNGGSLFGIYIVNLLLTIITLGFYYPWAKASVLKYLYGETELEGSRFTFHGTGKEMFIGFIKAIGVLGILYAILFAGIYSKDPMLMAATTIFYILAIVILIPFAIHGSMRYRMSRSSWRGIHFGYRGNRGTFIKEFLVGVFLTVITLGIYSSWFTITIRKYIIDNIRFGNIKFQYTGRGSDYFMLILIGNILTVLTLGIYGFWYAKDLFNFYVENIELEQGDKRGYLRSSATGGGYFRLLIGNLFIIIFSLGLAAPWATIRTLKFVFSNISIEGDFDADSIIQTEKDYSDATGEDVVDMLDLGLV